MKRIILIMGMLLLSTRLYGGMFNLTNDTLMVKTPTTSVEATPKSWVENLVSNAVMGVMTNLVLITNSPC